VVLKSPRRCGITDKNQTPKGLAFLTLMSSDAALKSPTFWGFFAFQSQGAYDIANGQKLPHP
jgi:hypothetical protein